ncbi:amidohydrolase family protein [Mangrovicoccus ximenensis]|uniref:amidohydrolase family protein n=1 Tax=Mangrovicoccus ximenensis TaxID=1911570 RepID=UPI000D3AE928|nr:amidohydrolase family protein [Mangrovicoccus ximenensis]
MNEHIFATVMAPDDRFLALAPEEPVLEPELPVIDTHMHLWHRQPDPPYFVPEFAQDIAACGHNVVGSVFVECHTMYRNSGPDHLKWIGETEFAAGQAAMSESGAYGARGIASAIVGFADLRCGDRLRDTLEAHVAAAGGRFRGIRQRAKWDADPKVKGSWSADAPHLYLDPAFRDGLRTLAAMGLSFDASIYHPQLPDVVQMARDTPEAEIVLIHSGSPVGHNSYRGREAENHAVWLDGIKALADCPNVSVKLGGILMNLGNYDFTAAARPPGSQELADLWRPYIEPCIEHLGAGRCMVSSNFPVDKCGFPYRTVWNMFKRITAGCSEAEKALLYSGTARRVYKMAPQDG